MSAVSPPIDGLILAARRRPIGNVCGAPLCSRPQLAPSEAAEDAGYPESQNRAEADRKHDDPPNPGRKIVHGVVSPAARTEAMLRSRWLMRCEHAVANVGPGISRSARVHSHGAGRRPALGAPVPFPTEVLPPGGAARERTGCCHPGRPRWAQADQPAGLRPYAAIPRPFRRGS